MSHRLSISLPTAVPSQRAPFKSIAEILLPQTCGLLAISTYHGALPTMSRSIYPDMVKVMNQVVRRNAQSLRGVEGPAKEAVVGQALADARFVKVDWGWIALPGALLLLSGVFLFATVIRTSKWSTRTGKTSGLGHLFNDAGERWIPKWLAIPPEKMP